LLIEAVAAHLAFYKFTLKTDTPSAFKPDIKEPIPEQLKFEPLTASKEWDAGVIVATAQNLTRTVRSLSD
jgi:aminopeptidase